MFLIFSMLTLFSCHDNLMEDVTPYTLQEEIDLDTIPEIDSEIEISTTKDCAYDCNYYYYRYDSIIDVRMNFYHFEIDSAPYFGIKIYRFNGSYVLHLESTSELATNRNIQFALSDGSIVELQYTAWQFDVGANVWATRYDINEDDLDLLKSEEIDRLQVPFEGSDAWYPFTSNCHRANISSQISCTQK